MLAATVGLDVLVFTLVNALWLRPLPIHDPDHVVAVVGTTFGTTESPALRIFDGVAGQVDTAGSNEALRPRLRIPTRDDDLEVAGVTHGYFRVLGLSVRGRDFTLDDERTGAPAVVIVSDRLWRSAFQQRADIIGLLINSAPVSVRVIGVAPPGFDGAARGENTDMWIPLGTLARVVPFGADPANLPLDVLARLKPGETLTDANRRFRESTGGQYKDASVVPVGALFENQGAAPFVIHEGGSLAVLAGLATLVLLGGCAALAALVLVHYECRQLEMAVRAALGALPGRLILGLVTELVSVAALGTVGALAIAAAGLRSVPAMRLAGGVDFAHLDLSMDWRVLLAAISLSLVTLALAASVPVVRATRYSAAAYLAAGPAVTASRGSQRLRQSLLAALVTATIVVLVAAGLFVRTVNQAFGKAPGFDAEHTTFVAVDVISPRIGDIADISRRTELATRRTDLVRDALRSIPGVDGVAEGTAPIGSTDLFYGRASVQARIGQQETRLGIFRGSADLLSVLGIPILEGRGLRAADASKIPTPVVLTSSVARRLWPGEDPLAKSMFTSASGRSVVVGIARDFAFRSLTDTPQGVLVAVSAPGNSGLEPRFVVHGYDPANVASEISRVLRDTVPDVVPVEVMTGPEAVARDIGRQRLGAWFFSGFGMVALLLGLGGVFGLVSYLAEARRREFAMRLALGATSTELVRLAAMTALVPSAVGVGVGLAIASLVSRAFASLLFGTSPIDPVTYAGVALIMLGCSTVAAVVAAWRLRNLMPAQVLHAD